MTANLLDVDTLMREAELLHEQQSIEYLDQPWAILCDVIDCGIECTRTATWWVICTACRHAYAECNPHRRIERELWQLPWIRLICCQHCPEQVPPARWRDLFHIQPIEGRP